MEVITLLRAIGVNKGSQKGALKSKALKQYVVPSTIRFHFRRCEKKTKTLESTKKYFNESQSLTGVELKEFSLLYLVMNNLTLLQSNIHLIENVKLFTKVNIQIFRMIIDKLGLDVYLSLIQINKYKKNLWAANWCYIALKNNLFTSYPVVSRISNIGFDGSGQGGFSNKYKNNLKIKIKKKYNFSKNISYDGYDQFEFIKNYNQNFIFQYFKFFLPKKLN